MAFEDLYRALIGPRTPKDVREAQVEQADEWVYRIAFASVPIAGIPEEMRIGGVEIHRAVGPLLTQRTEIRQRHGLPIVYDKVMHREIEVGRNAVLTVCQMREPIPKQPSVRIAELRDRAFAAVGVLAAVLDDRVAIEEVLEDIIFMAAGVPIAPGDARLGLRSFLPFDVGDEERASIEALSTLDIEGVTQISQAARYYVRAAQQGPVADSIILLWIALEALTPHRTTSPKTVEEMLLFAGFDPQFLDISVGRLAGLRADLVHKGEADPELVRAGYYRLEAIVRALLRRATGTSSAWPPILNPAVFGEQGTAIDRQAAMRSTVWHENELPPPVAVEPAGLDWERVQAPHPNRPSPPWLRVSGAIQPGWQARVTFWLAEAALALELKVDPPVEVVIGSPPGAPASVQTACNAARIVVRPELLKLPDPAREMRLALRLTEALAQVTLMRTGLESTGLGTTLIELVGAWAGHRTFYGQDGPLSEDDFVIRTKDANDLHTLGELLGAALAGSSKASAALAEWSNAPTAIRDLVEFADSILREWTDIESFHELRSRVLALIQVAQAARDDSA
jgi:hypothetical protein